MNRSQGGLRAGLLALAALAAAGLIACGGGGSDSSGSSTTYAMGRISGYGSIVVNGVHYDEGTATVEDEDGQSGSAADLGLGAMVEVAADRVDRSGSHPTAHAGHVRLVGLMRGPVESVGTDSFVVLGQTVKVTATTVYGSALAGGLAALRAGAVVRVFGTLDAATGVYTATRVEPKTGATFYSLRGVVAALDATARTLTIGTTVIDVSAVTLPSGLAAGSLVRVKLQTAQVAGRWVATSVQSARVRPHDSEHAEVEGTVSAFTSTAAFSVDGMPVDASNARFPDGTSGIVMGARVEVEGTVTNGTLVATKVELKSDERDAAGGFEVEGSITAVGASSFTVRGVTVNYSASTTIRNGAATDLAVGTRVEAHGVLAADGTTLQADSITIKRN